MLPEEKVLVGVFSSFILAYMAILGVFVWWALT